MIRSLIFTAITFLSIIAMFPIITKIWFWLVKQWFKLWHSDTDTKKRKRKSRSTKHKNGTV